jgi:hypothetical protein
MAKASKMKKEAGCDNGGEWRNYSGFRISNWQRAKRDPSAVKTIAGTRAMVDRAGVRSGADGEG